MDGYPDALVIASLEEVNQNNNVLYRLVKPLPDGSGVQSVERLVNVVPHRRSYTFEHKGEVDTFRHELLKRPIVLQPVVHFGRGLGHSCGLCYQDELWIVMVNQTHPKILSRLQVGLDIAKTALDRGQSFEIKFCFGKLIERVYREHLAQKERGEAENVDSGCAHCLTHFRFAEWDHGDLTLRYHGYAAKMRRNVVYELVDQVYYTEMTKNIDLEFGFEDVGMHEMFWSHTEGHVFAKPHLAPVYEDEIRQMLPAWTINQVSPLEDIGETAPEQNYSYAQAGRLYESFRRKKRQHHRPQPEPVEGAIAAAPYGADYEDGLSDDNAFNEKVEGATGSSVCAPPPSYSNLNKVEIEHDFSGYDQNQSAPQTKWRGRYHEPEGYDPDGDYYNQSGYAAGPASPGMSYENNEGHARGAPVERHDPSYSSRPNTQHHEQKSPQAAPVRPDRHGHFDANVKVKPATRLYSNSIEATVVTTHQPGSNSNYSNLDPRSSDYHPYANGLKKQDSDRSSRSTNGDSGYSAEGDGWRSRGDSYDYNEQVQVTKLKPGREGLGNYPHGRDSYHDGLENPAFNDHDHEADIAMKKHKELVARMLQDQAGGPQPKKSFGPPSVHGQGPSSSYQFSPKDIAQDVVRAPPRQKRLASNEPQISESFI